MATIHTEKEALKRWLKRALREGERLRQRVAANDAVIGELRADIEELDQEMEDA